MVNYLSSLSDFNQTSIFWAAFSKNTQIPNFMKIRLVQTYRQTDMVKANSRLPQFLRMPQHITQH